MRKIWFAFIYVACLACFKNATAQNNQILLGLKGGISIPNLKSSGSNPLSMGWESRLGPYFGVVSEIPLGSSIALQAELNYSSQGGKKSGAQALPSSGLGIVFPPGIPIPPYLYANFNSEAILNYLEVPVLLKINFPISNQFSFFVDAGPYAGFLMSAKNITKGSSNIYLDENLTEVIWPIPTSFDSTVNIKEDINNFNFGIQAGVGLSLKLPNGKLMLTGGGNIGFLNIQKEEINGTNKTGAGTVTLAYLIEL